MVAGLSNEIAVQVILLIIGVNIALKLLWGLLNFISDKLLRRKGWDEQDEWTPMVDYVPFWRLFSGVEDMSTKNRRRTF